MPNFGPKHTLAYGLNFVFGLLFVATFAYETFHVYSGVCQLYLRLDATDGTVHQDQLPVCNVLLAFHAIFQVAWPLALMWAYAVASGICVRLCNNSCCCPTAAAAAGAAGHDEVIEQQADDGVVQQSPGCCQRCCLCVLLLDFRKSLRGSFRATERRVFVILAGLHVGITVYFGMFLTSIVVGYAARCSIADSRDQVRMYRGGDSYGTVRSSNLVVIMNMVAYDTLRRADLCFTNPITMIILVSACCSYACNVANLVMYIWRWLVDELDSL